MEAAREAYDAFLSHYPYCYGYWRKYADYEKRKGNKKKCEEVRRLRSANECFPVLFKYTHVIILQSQQLILDAATALKILYYLMTYIYNIIVRNSLLYSYISLYFVRTCIILQCSVVLR